MSQDQASRPGAPASSETRRWSSGPTLLVLFLIALWLPLLDMSVDMFPKVDIAEKRPPVAPPRLTWRGIPTFIQKCEPYYKENFGLRDILVNWDNRVRLKLLHTLPVSKLIVGREGWIFYASEKVPDGTTIADYKGLAPYSRADLERILGNLRARVRWCRERGADCLFVVVPNKETMYPEYLPSSIRRIGRQTRLDQVLEALGPGSDVPLVDLRPALRQAKTECPYPLYNRGGTHWNQYGAYYGYREISRVIARLHPRMKPYALEDFLIEGDPRSAEDHWLGLKENYYFKFALKPTSIQSDPGAGVGKVVALYDSFWIPLGPFFTLHFPDLAAQHYSRGRDQNQAFVESEKPALILYEIAERYADAWWGW
jgi:hypothetical protein